MHKLSREDMLRGKQSRYSLVVGVAKRAREIVAEAEIDGRIIVDKPVILAAKDYEEDKYDIYEPEINE